MYAMCRIVLCFNKCQQQIRVETISVKGGSSPLSPPACAPGRGCGNGLLLQG